MQRLLPPLAMVASFSGFKELPSVEACCATQVEVLACGTSASSPPID
jgi:hypothetical protein